MSVVLDRGHLMPTRSAAGNEQRWGADRALNAGAGDKLEPALAVNGKQRLQGA